MSSPKNFYSEVGDRDCSVDSSKFPDFLSVCMVRQFS